MHMLFPKTYSIDMFVKMNENTCMLIDTTHNLNMFFNSILDMYVSFKGINTYIGHLIQNVL